LRVVSRRAQRFALRTVSITAGCRNAQRLNCTVKPAYFEGKIHRKAEDWQERRRARAKKQRKKKRKRGLVPELIRPGVKIPFQFPET
jgi:hypothetical protein